MLLKLRLHSCMHLFMPPCVHACQLSGGMYMQSIQLVSFALSDTDIQDMTGL